MIHTSCLKRGNIGTQNRILKVTVYLKREPTSRNFKKFLSFFDEYIVISFVSAYPPPSNTSWEPVSHEKCISNNFSKPCENNRASLINTLVFHPNTFFNEATSIRKSPPTHLTLRLHWRLNSSYYACPFKRTQPGASHCSQLPSLRLPQFRPRLQLFFPLTTLTFSVVTGQLSYSVLGEHN